MVTGRWIRRSRLGAGLCLAFVAASTSANPTGPINPVAPYQEEIAQEAAELEKVQRNLERAKEERQGYIVRETRILTQLNGLDEEVSLKQRLVAGLSRKEDRLNSDLSRTRTRLVRERERLVERRSVLRRRLRNIYKFGERPGLQVLLGATSAVDLVRRFDWLLLVAEQDRRLFGDIQASVARVRETEAELAKKQHEVQEIRLQSEREQAALVTKRSERRSLLESVRGEKASREQLIGELEQAERRMQELLAELEAKAKLVLEGGLPPEGTGFEQMKGNLPWPVVGKVTRWYGVQKDRRFGTSTFNGGIDIEAASETEVVAVHMGRADYVNWLPGYGQCIILNHGQGFYSLYAHTSKVFVSAGDMVTAGEVIATVGETGSLLGNILHFEIRQNAEPVNPAPWMKSTPLK